MNYDTVSLGDVCEFLDNQRVPITESDRKPGPYPYYGANGQQDSIDNYIFDEPLVLLAEDGGYFGSKDRPIAYKVTGKCWVNNHAHVLRPKSNIDVDYLHRVLSYYDVTKYVNGTTRQKLTKGNAENISFPLPPLTEQKRIASLLARADRLRQLRRTAHDLGDALLQSVFLEMFGDPIANPNGWDKVVIEELVSDMRGGSPLEPEDFVDKGFPVLHKGAIKPWGEIELDPKKKTFTHDAFVQKYKRAVINRDYVVVTLRDLVPSGPSIGLVSKLTSSPYPEYILAQGAYAFLVNKKKLNADYLMALSNITSFRRFLRTLAVGSTQIHIRNPIYLEIAIPLPPITLQEKFSKVINQLQIVREQRYESERQIEILFQDLMNKVFAEGINES